MTLQITPGPLPANGTRIKVQQVLSAFVNGTTIQNFGLSDFDAADLTQLFSSTDAPSGADLTTGMLWFKRGEGAVYHYISRLEAQDETNTQTESLWARLSDGRQIICRVLEGVPVDSEPLWWSTDFSEWRAVTHPGGTAFSPIMHHTSDTNTNARTVLHDPILVSANTGVSDTTKGVTTHGYPTVAWEWGFCQAKVRGNGPIVYLSSLFADIDAYGADTLLATSASLAGASMAEVGVLAESSASIGTRTATIFLRPSLSNALHGDHTV